MRISTDNSHPVAPLAGGLAYEGDALQRATETHARWLSPSVWSLGTSALPNSFKNGVGIWRMEIDMIRAPVVIFLPLEATIKAAVCDDFFGGAIAFGEAI